MSRWIALSSLAALAACQPSPSLPAASVVMSGFTLESGGSSFPAQSVAQLRAWGHLSDGRRVDLTTQTQWSSSHPSIAQIGPSGVLTLGQPGTARIEGRFEEHLVLLSVTSVAAALQELSVSAASGPLALGDSRRVTAWARYADGRRVDVTAQARWRTDGLVEPASTPGLFIARAQGLGLIAAQLGGREASLNVQVAAARATGLRVQSFASELRPGQLRQLRAFARFSDGSERDVTLEAAWTSSQGAIALRGAGLVEAMAFGHAQVDVAWGELTASITLAVHERRLLGLEVDRATLTIPQGLVGEVHALARFDDGSVEDACAEVEWQLGDPAVVGAPDARGAVHTLAEGQAVITAVLQGLTKSVQVFVGPPAVVRLTPTLAGGRMRPDDATTLKVVARLSDGSSSDVTNGVRVLASNHLQVAANGPLLELRAVSVGPATLALELGGVSEHLSIEVTASTVSAVELVEATPAALPGPAPLLRHFRALAHWSDGALTDVTELGSWWIDDSTAAEVFDDPGRRGAYVTGRGGKTDVRFALGAAHSSLTWDF
jgi:hypothetical protein